MRVCAALPRSSRCSTRAAASFFLCSGSTTATARVGVAVWLRSVNKVAWDSKQNSLQGTLPADKTDQPNTHGNVASCAFPPWYNCPLISGAYKTVLCPCASFYSVYSIKMMQAVKTCCSTCKDHNKKATYVRCGTHSEIGRSTIDVEQKLTCLCPLCGACHGSLASGKLVGALH